MLTPSAGGIVEAKAVVEVLSMWTKIGSHHDVRVVIEQVHAMPKQGVSSTFKFGTSFGTAIGIVVALELPLYRVTPQAWKKTFALTGKPKDASRLKAIEIWPGFADTFKLKKSVDAAEAALIAEHGRRTL
jgi:crossover junction endodeoxyribonuclease RuvC